MAETISKLAKLAAMAAEPSSEKRRELLSEITDLFLGHSSTYSDRENWYFGEIIGDIAFTMEAQIRATLAERLSNEAIAPAALMRKLANDEISVARQVIENSLVLSESDLVEIAECQGQDHLLAITKRPDITEVLSSVLVDRGNDAVVEGLLDNRTAAISHGSMAQIVDRAGSNDKITSSLLRRPDLPKEMMMDFVSSISADIREKILREATGIDRERLESVLDEVTVEQQDSIARQQPSISTPESVISDLVASGTLNPLKLVEFARAKKLPEFICGLAKLANTDMETAQKVAMDSTGEGLALICRSCAFSQRTFADLIRAVGPLISISTEDIEQQAQLYEMVTVANAQRVFRFWKIRKQANAGAGASAA